nr:hypothetical protein [Tanacetum cinerariifolium]
MRQTIADRLSMVYTEDDRHALFTSHAWRRLFEVRGPLVREFMLEFFSTYRMSDTEIGLDVVDTLSHFRLVSDQGLRGLSVVSSELPLIDLHKLGRLNICLRVGDIWAWVASGLKRQQAAATGAPGAADASSSTGLCDRGSRKRCTSYEEYSRLARSC